MRKIAFLALLLLVTACLNPPPPKKAVTLNFAGRPMAVDASSIEVLDNYRSPFKAPNVEHMFPIPPAKGVKSLIDQKLVASGNEGVLKVTVIKADVVETPLVKQNAPFYKDKAYKYEGELQVEVKLYKPGDTIARSTVNVGAKRTRYSRRDLPVDQQEAFFNQFTQDILNDLASSLENNMRQHMSGYIKG